MPVTTFFLICGIPETRFLPSRNIESSGKRTSHPSRPSATSKKQRLFLLAELKISRDVRFLFLSPLKHLRNIVSGSFPQCMKLKTSVSSLFPFRIMQETLFSSLPPYLISRNFSNNVEINKRYNNIQ